MLVLYLPVITEKNIFHTGQVSNKLQQCRSTALQHENHQQTGKKRLYYQAFQGFPQFQQVLILLILYSSILSFFHSFVLSRGRKWKIENEKLKIKQEFSVEKRKWN